MTPACAGTEGITRTMAGTFVPDTARVNTVLPGSVATERRALLNHELDQPS